MLQQWNLRSRGHQCAVSERPFEDGEKHFTAIYLDSKTGEYTRRDVCIDAWKQEQAERKPFSFWKSIYVKNAPDQKPEFAPKESALTLLQRLIEDDQPNTENARYILAAMLERKRILAPTDRKYTEQGIMQFYENKKTGDVYMIRDPELRLDEVAGVQEEVAMLLGFGGPAVEAAKAVGMKMTPEGKVEPESVEAVTPSDQPAAASEVVEASDSELPTDELVTDEPEMLSVPDEEVGETSLDEPALNADMDEQAAELEAAIESDAEAHLDDEHVQDSSSPEADDEPSLTVNPEDEGEDVMEPELDDTDEERR